MDSISDNVVAIIAVVIGILIIGTALIPIVEHASSGPGATEVITGSNDYYDGSNLVILVTENHTLSVADDTVALDGQPCQGSIFVSNYYLSDAMGTQIISAAIEGLVDLNNDVTLSSGTATLTPDLATLTGITASDAASYSQTMDMDQAALVLEMESVPAAIMSNNDMYGEMANCTIGDGQTMYLVHVTDIDEYAQEAIPITTSTATVTIDGVSLTKNSNGTATVDCATEYAYIIGPLEWSQTITTESGTSQYAALYGIIPIMCILAMAYVLIRRF